MIHRNVIIAVAAICAGVLASAPASAETAITDADLNLRVGPSTSYGVIDVIPHGHPVEVIGCVDDFDWCDIAWEGLRGWVAARYLVQPGTSVYLPQWGPSIGLPIISFSFTIYHDRHYQDRPWHRERRWSGRWRDRRDERRAERREQRHDAERREAVEREERREAVEREGRREAVEGEERRPQRGQQRRTERPQQRGRALQQQRGPRAEPPGRARGRGGDERKRPRGRGR